MPAEKITEEETNKEPLHKEKTYSYKEDRNIRFSFPYHSPVIKKENMVFIISINNFDTVIFILSGKS